MEKIYQLTRTGTHTLRVTLEDWDGETRDAEYSQFRLEDESDRYRLRFGSYTQGSAGDSLKDGGYVHKDRPFVTPDTGVCGRECKSGWWFLMHSYHCVDANLNGEYRTSPSVGRKEGIMWWTWRRWYSYKLTSMKIRRHT